MLTKSQPAIDGVGPWRYGDRIEYFVDDAYITTSLKLYGEYSELEVDLWRKLIVPGATVVDVGANIGALTIPLAQIVGEHGRVVAFEPQPQLHSLLKRNVNQLTNVDVFDYALGACECLAPMPPLERLGHTNFGDVSLQASGDLLSYSVSVDKLDNILLADTSVAFVKIDVQGFEANVLRGARRTIGAHRPILYLESDRPEKRDELISLLDELGYNMWWHTPPLYNPNNFNRCTLNVFGNVVSVNMLCLPKEQGDPQLGLTRVELSSKAPAIITSKWACVVRLGGLGDNLQTAALLKPLAEQGYKIDVITQKPGHVIFENNPYVTKLSVKEHERDLPQGNMEAWLAWFESRSHEYDKFVNLSFTCEGLLAFFPAMGTFWQSAKFRRKLADHSYIETMADAADVPYDFGGHLFWPTMAEHDDINRMYQKVSDDGRRKVIGWCVTGTRIDKIHPYSPMIIARLIRELEASVVMFAAPPPYRDIETVKVIQEHVARQNGVEQWLFHAGGTGKNEGIPYQPPGQMVVGLPVEWPIRRSLTMAMHCDMLIGPDTGIMWAGAFEPMPKIMLMSHASPKNITSHWVNTVTLHADQSRVPCWPCHRLHDSAATCVQNKENNGAACISDISVETIVSTAARLFSNGD